jgi:hypothetical protein
MPSHSEMAFLGFRNSSNSRFGHDERSSELPIHPVHLPAKDHVTGHLHSEGISKEFLLM